MSSHRNIKRMIGKRFGIVTVLEQTDERDKFGYCIYKCKCDCGKILFISNNNLHYYKSCGCLKSDIRKLCSDKRKDHFENTQLAMLNSKPYKNNTSGVKGVTWDRGKWKATIMLQGKQHYLGRFDDIETAKRAREIAENELYKPILEKYQQKESEE